MLPQSAIIYWETKNVDELSFIFYPLAALSFALLSGWPFHDFLMGHLTFGSWLHFNLFRSLMVHFTIRCLTFSIPYSWTFEVALFQTLVFKWHGKTSKPMPHLVVPHSPPLPLRDTTYPAYFIMVCPPATRHSKKIWSCDNFRSRNNAAYPLLFSHQRTQNNCYIG